MKLYHRIILGLLIGCMGLLLYLLISLVYPYKVIDVKNGHALDIVPTKITSGGMVGVIFDYCKYMSIRSSTTKNLIVNGIIYFLAKDSSIRPVPVGCHKVTLYHQLPEGLEGEAQIHIYSSYKINLFRTVHYEWETKEFMIEASASPKVGDIK